MGNIAGSYSPPRRGGECVPLDHSSLFHWTSLAPPGLKNCILRTMAVFGSTKWRVLSRLKLHLRRYRGRIAAGFGCVLLTNLFLLAAPRVTGYAVDSLTQSITREKLAYYALAVIGLAVCEGIFRFSMRRLIIGVSRDIEYELRNDLVQHLETLPASFYQTNKTGDLMSRATNDLSNVRMLLGPGIMSTANT